MRSQDSINVEKKPLKWFERVNFRGYTQVRYNRLLETNPDLKCEQCDKSIGDGGGISLRRARLIFSGKLTEKISFYIQPDLASTIGTNTHVLQLRDAYVDLGFDKMQTFRLRLGQSKIPFGFENIQSSSNRISLDRADGINVHLPNERDVAGIFYYTPPRVTLLFERLLKEGLKGSGNYGLFAFGVFNGETANKVSRNNQLYVVSRLTYPFEWKSQIVEFSVQAMKGKYTLENFTSNLDNNLFDDEHVAGSLILYPRPFGVQAEYSVGRAPRYDKVTNTTRVAPSKGGYIMMMFQAPYKEMTFIPFVKYQVFDGGKKAELDARSYKVKDFEIGTEWQINKACELTVQYTISDRTFEDALKPNNAQVGNYLRLQLQFNY